MPGQTNPTHICPFLGLADDRDSRFSYPEPAHLCFAAGRPAPITLEHQSSFCLSAEHPTCPRYAGAGPDDFAAAAAKAETWEEASRFPLWAIVLSGLAGLLVVVIAFHFYLSSLLRPAPSPSQASPPSSTPTASPVATPTPTREPIENTATPLPVALLVTPTATNTSQAGERIYTLSPDASDIGWVASGERRANHFGDSFLYAGVFEENVYLGAFQFDLSSIPRGAPIYAASLQMTGLRDDRLGDGGNWSVRILASEIDENWRQHGYQEIFNAPALQALTPILSSDELIKGRTNTFELSPAQIALIEERILENENPKISFRIEGPLAGPDNLFAWDTGYGERSQGNKVILSLSVGQPPATPPSFDYIVVTSTPTPENVLTAAAIIAQMTVDATRIGTATPLPPNLATATPFPPYLVIIPTATPGNAATAYAMSVLATARALTTGTPTPIPTNAVTATPIPSPTPYILVMITATPTPASIFAAATLSAEATAQTQRFGPPTPLPPNWVTPYVVTSTPTPANQATAEYLNALATAQAFTTGTPTPTPINMVTATPTPVFVLLDGELPPVTATTPPPEPGSRRMPPELIGKIAFKSDRSGEEQIYVINPDGSGLGLLSDRWPYEMAIQADVCSADGRFRAFVKDAIIDTGVEDKTTGSVRPIQLRVPAVFYYDAFYAVEEQVTHFGVDENHQPFAYDPAWSPVADRIAFVSDDSGNDEIWVINPDGSGALQLTRNEWEWDKHPSWSPDGTHIVFWSNRTGIWQIWVMDANGDNLYSLSRTGFNDWDPVWIKYPDVPCQGFQSP
ncbi:MAG: hypothetical protein Kow0063_09660 [Anaerolineae bacterium]